MTSIYLISPPQIEPKIFTKKLEKILKTYKILPGKIPLFQLRLKDKISKQIPPLKIISPIAREIQKICRDYDCKFLLNDDYEAAIELGLDGVHIGGEDGEIAKIRQKSGKNFLIGASCYDSQDLAIKAAKSGADYISFGAFFETKTKNSPGRPKPEIISWAKQNFDLPIAAIGGIDGKNCKILVENGVDYLAIISAIWNQENAEIEAIEEILEGIKNGK